MPKIETFLKTEEIEDVEDMAKEKGLSRSAYIRAVVVFSIEYLTVFEEWLEGNIDRFK